MKYTGLADMADNHAPWDDGLLTSLSASLGLPAQRTIKTLCGRRVSPTRANADAPTTCAECAAEKQALADMAALLEASRYEDADALLEE